MSNRTPADLNRRIDEILGQPGAHGPQILLSRLNRTFREADFMVDGRPLELEQLDDVLKLSDEAVGIALDYLARHYTKRPDIVRQASDLVARKRTQGGTHRKAG